MYAFPDNFDQLSQEEKQTVFDEMREYDLYDRELVKLANFLLGELSVRENNEHVGTGRGGNPSQLFHLLSLKLEWKSTTDESFSFNRLSEDLLKINVPEKILEDVKNDRPADLCLFRDALDAYWESLSERKEVSFDQLMSPRWIEALGDLTSELKAYLSYLKKIVALKTELDLKDKVLDNFSEICNKDRNAIVNQFLNEIGLSKEQLKECQLLEDTLYDHPVFGEALKKIDEREEQLIKDLFSEEDVRLLKTITIMPSYITILSMRCISIENAVKYNLDNYVNNEKFDNIKVKVNVAEFLEMENSTEKEALSA